MVRHQIENFSYPSYTSEDFHIQGGAFQFAINKGKRVTGGQGFSQWLTR